MTKPVLNPEQVEVTLETICNLRHRQLETDISVKLLVEHAIHSGATWRAVGAALGTSGQAAWEKYRPKETPQQLAGQDGLF